MVMTSVSKTHSAGSIPVRCINFMSHILSLNELTQYLYTPEELKEKTIKFLMEEHEVDEEEALEIYNQVALAQVQDALDSLIEKGLVEVSGYTDEGEPIYKKTTLGEKVAAEEEKQQKEKNSSKKKKSRKKTPPEND